jgi:VWFA-related protein
MKRLRTIACALLTLSAGAQPITQSINVTIVEVPVSVIGADGKAVHGLTKAQFEVYDQGRRVPIESFEVIDMRAIDAGNTAQPLPPAAVRHFLLLFDVASSSPGTIKRAAEAALEFVDRELGPRDLAAVATFTAEAGARMITSFTNHRETLHAAILTLGKPNYFHSADPLMISFAASEAGTQLSSNVVEVDPKVANPGSNLAGQLDAFFAAKAEESNRAEQRTRDSEGRNRLSIQLGQMGRVAAALDRLHGQKQIILLSEGFDPKLIQGREKTTNDAAQKEMEQVLNGEAYKVDTDQRFGNTSSSTDVREMVSLFRRSDVVLHAIDIKGLRATTSSDVASGAGAGESADRTLGKSNEGLFALTAPTGGTVFRNVNDLAGAFAKMVEQQDVTYLLGIRATSDDDAARFHALRVKVNVPNTRVSHRAGYYNDGGKQTDVERTLSLAEILLTDAPVRDVPLTFSATVLPGPQRVASVPVVVELPGNALMEGVQSDRETASVFVYAFDRKNQVVDFLTQKLSLDLTKVGATLTTAGLRYFGTLELPPGDYAVKALVRVEETGRTGFARTTLSVPASSGTATVMPPVLLEDRPQWPLVGGSIRHAAYPFTAAGRRFAPRVPAVIASSSNASRLALFTHGLPLEQVTIEPVGDSGRVTIVDRAQLADGVGRLLLDFDTRGMTAGAHELRLRVMPGNTEVTMPFVIE